MMVGMKINHVDETETLDIRTGTGTGTGVTVHYYRCSIRRQCDVQGVAVLVFTRILTVFLFFSTLNDFSSTKVTT
jgi:hypothetical protein